MSGRYEIPVETLTATIEALDELKGRYEMEAWALARVDGMAGIKLARERLEQAETIGRLAEFYGGL